jgi:simple sugar transport system permease protein
VPLVLAGVAVSLAFTGGILNIGAEGQLLAAGRRRRAPGSRSPGAGGWRAGRRAPGGALAGAAWAGIAALLRRGSACSR